MATTFGRNFLFLMEFPVYRGDRGTLKPKTLVGMRFPPICFSPRKFARRTPLFFEKASIWAPKDRSIEMAGRTRISIEFSDVLSFCLPDSRRGGEESQNASKMCVIAPCFAPPLELRARRQDEFEIRGDRAALIQVQTL